MGKLEKYFTKIIGKEKHTFKVEGEDLYDVLMTEKKLSFDDVKECGLCKSEDLTLGAHLAKQKHKYVHITCKKCRGYVNLGRQQEQPDVFFLRLKKDEDGKTMKGENGRPMIDWQKYSREEMD